MSDVTIPTRSRNTPPGAGDIAQFVDLLYEEPQTRIRLGALQRALSYAFSAGDTSSMFERALQHATITDTAFDETCFRHDLFVDQFLERCTPSASGEPASTAARAYVKQVLCSPPRSVATTRFRQAIMSELSEDEGLQTRFENVFNQARELRTLLEATDAGVRYDINQRRIDVLRLLRSIIDAFAIDFTDCTSELKRLSVFGNGVREAAGFQRLCELLDYEANVATMDLRVRVGADGRLRSFELLDHVENKGSVFHQHWLWRLWRRVWLLLRGYRMGEQELMVRLSDSVFEGLRAEVLQLFQLLGDMEFYRAGLGLRRLAMTQGLSVCLPGFDQTRGMKLEGLFNPFLVAEGVPVRCCNIDQPAPDTMTIITGPNSGGKTRLLQAIGWSQLLGQCGLPVPAKSATLCWAGGMFVSIVQETSAAQREGQLGMELLRIRRLFEQVAPGDVIVLDELCSGTNPSEGEEIFRLVIELLSELGPQLWLTTHFLQFAQRLQSEAGIPRLAFMQVELDENEQPTYGFVPGVAQSSLAGQTAERLGVTWTELSALVQRAKRRRAPP